VAARERVSRCSLAPDEVSWPKTSRSRPRGSSEEAAHERQSGSIDPHLESAGADHITVTLIDRGRRQQDRFRSKRMRIRALVRPKVGASAITQHG